MPKGAPGNLERGFGQGPVGTGQGQWLEPARGEIELSSEAQVLPWEGAEALAQGAQRSCDCPAPGSVQGQAGTGGALRSLPT